MRVDRYLRETVAERRQSSVSVSGPSGRRRVRQRQRQQQRQALNDNDTYLKLVRMTTGCLKKEATEPSISEWVLMKFRVRSGRLRESLAHCPGRGSGTCQSTSFNQGNKSKINSFFPILG